VIQGSISTFLRDLVFETFNHAFVNWFHFVTRAANEVVMVVMPVPRPDFVPGRPIDPGDPLYQIFFFENGNKPEYGGEVTAVSAHLFVNVRQRQRNRTGIEQADDGQTSAGGAQIVLPQPRSGLDGGSVLCRSRTHTYLYHR